MADLTPPPFVPLPDPSHLWQSPESIDAYRLGQALVAVHRVTDTATLHAVAVAMEVALRILGIFPEDAEETAIDVLSCHPLWRGADYLMGICHPIFASLPDMYQEPS